MQRVLDERFIQEVFKDMSEAEITPMSPLNYLKVFFRRKNLIIVPMIIGLVGGICSGLLLPKKYKSSTVLLVEEGKTDNPLFNELAVSTTVSQRLTTIRESMLGWNSLVTLVKRLEMDTNIQNAFEFERLILDIRNSIQIGLRSQNIIDLSFIHEDAELTKKVVENITSIFIERNIEIQNQDTVDAIYFIEEQLKVYRGKIKSSEIALLREELNTLLVDSTEKHPRVKLLREQLSAKEEELRKEQLEYSEDAVLDASTTNPLIEEIKRTLNQIEGGATANFGKDSSITKVMLIDKLDDVMARDVGINNELYSRLLERLETAKITQRLQSSKEGTKYTVLDPPRLPLKPYYPNMWLVSAIGLLGGLALGAALVFGMEFLDNSFIDVEEANQFFGKPLLGAISKIETEESLRKSREKVIWMYSIIVVCSILIIVVAKIVSTYMA